MSLPWIIPPWPKIGSKWKTTRFCLSEPTIPLPKAATMNRWEDLKRKGFFISSIWMYSRPALKEAPRSWRRLKEKMLCLLLAKLAWARAHSFKELPARKSSKLLTLWNRRARIFPRMFLRRRILWKGLRSAMQRLRKPMSSIASPVPPQAIDRPYFMWTRLVFKTQVVMRWILLPQSCLVKLQNEPRAFDLLFSSTMLRSWRTAEELSMLF
mmetsp:Transcript_4124/g.11904  ORF Transcript_4124/g.11904 Transcript_4124/m.11904 type:complete len:211 (+) Transcript_4124:721-1353(+)